MNTYMFKGNEISALGLGCMRFPLCGAEQDRVDENKTAEMIDYAIKNGINYFDTAWGYHGGESETIVGKILSAYPRNSFYLATKYPAFKIDTMKDPKSIFEKQLEKCQTEYFDFYLCHNVCERNIEWFLDPKFGVVDYLIQQKKAGRIRHLGFSTHGSRSVIKRFLDAYRNELEFCQIQLNYLDWKLQSAREKVELLENYGIPVWVMEPVRGGRLAVLDEKNMSTLHEYRPCASAPEWAFRFLQSVDNVGVVLSGMSNMEQLKENIQIFSEKKPLNKQEWKMLMDISNRMIASDSIPCTACSYCIDRCVQGLPIPDLLKAYNEKTVPAGLGPNNCIGCRQCEGVCPQGIKISEVMAHFVTRLKEGI